MKMESHSSLSCFSNLTLKIGKGKQSSDWLFN